MDDWVKAAVASLPQMQTTREEDDSGGIKMTKGKLYELKDTFISDERGIYRSGIEMVLDEAKKEFPRCGKCFYIEKNNQGEGECNLNLYYESLCPKNKWFEEYLGDVDE